MSDHDGIALLPIPGQRTEHTIRKWAALGVASWLALCALVAAIRWLVERTTAAVESMTQVDTLAPWLGWVVVVPMFILGMVWRTYLHARGIRRSGAKTIPFKGASALIVIAVLALMVGAFR